jgi:uncharacterized protein (TIGR03435 family)
MQEISQRITLAPLTTVVIRWGDPYSSRRFNLKFIAAATVAPSVPMLFGSIRTQSTQSFPRPANMPKWETVSIKTCGDVAAGVNSTGIPGRLDLYCQSIRNLIRVAYLQFGGSSWPTNTPIEGAPEWIDYSYTYDIHARAAGDANQAMMLGPMLQVLLEEKFKLKIHPETRDVPVYRMTVAEGGLKLPPFEEGSCTPLDLSGRLQEFYVIDSNNRCPVQFRQGWNRVVSIQGATLDDFAKLLRFALDRPVINDTGIQGRFNFDLEYSVTAPSGLPAPAPQLSINGVLHLSPTNDPGRDPSIFLAVEEQLGLRLEPGNGHVGEYLVVDHLERPSPN